MSTPIGQRFSHVYMDRGAPARDSKRFRYRLAEYFGQHVGIDGDTHFRVAKAMGSELGIRVPENFGGYMPSEVFRSGELRDVLDSITLVYRVLRGVARPKAAEGWCADVARAMAEENVGYRVDEQCGVHYHVDEEFEHNRAAGVAALQHQNLVGALAAHDDAYRHLDGGDTKAAVRSIFETVEIVARLVCPETKNLNRWLAGNTLKEQCLATMPKEQIEQRVMAGMFDGLADWVDALHNYRHGQGVPEPVAPSEQLAIYAMSSGSAYARLIAECYLRTLSGSAPVASPRP